MRTKTPRSNTPGLRLVGGGESGSASTIYGCERQNSTILQPTNKDQVLSELLKCLENRVEILESRYSEVLDTFLSVTEHLVRLNAFTTNSITIDKE